jgi:endogenous inhibitor of DNA gyrase (YacG/DUF329 family)
MEKKFCKQCEKEIVGKNKNKKIFCSVNCRRQYDRNMRKQNFCKNCGKDISNKSSRYKFCSHSCAASYNNLGRVSSLRKIRTCIVCHKEYYYSKSYSKYCSKECSIMPLKNMLIKNSPHSRHNIKNRLIKENFLKNICSICGLPSMWNSKPIVMVLDHINGDSKDYRIENLRLVCPNCNSQLDTFTGRNIGHNKK